MRILVLVTGEYGKRHVHNLEKRAPDDWTILSWQTPRALPIVLDYPEDYLPEVMPDADLILSLAELPGVAEMIPDIVEMTGAQAVIAPIDSQVWLPFGLARQLREDWLGRMDIPCVTPMPFCTLTETHVNALGLRTTYDSDLIREFARHFGRPEFEVKVDKKGGTITEVKVTRDACCGCAHFAAEKLVGTPTEDALEQVGLHHHHYPCQATMGIDPLYGDTLLHISGNVMKDSLKEALGDNLVIRYIRPSGHVESED